jgi:hypothetical protein
MIRLSDIISGEIFRVKKPSSAGRPPCTPDLPKDPPPVKPPEPWCDTGPDPRIFGKGKRRRKR